MSAERILIVRLAGLGDLVTASVLLSRIRAERPVAHVTWLCGAAGAPIVALFDGVDEIVTVDERRLLAGRPLDRMVALLSMWVRLAGRRFDLVLVPQEDRRYRALLLPVRAHRVRMLVHDRSRMNPIPGRYFGDEWARLLDDEPVRGPVRVRYAIADVRRRLTTPSPASASGSLGVPLVALVPGGARNILRDEPLRRWPAERYAEVARRLRALGYRVAIVGDNADAWVRPHFQGVEVEDYIGALSLHQTLALFRDADLVISHDTGPMHLARLVRAPLLALFGPTTPRQVISDEEPNVVLWGGRELACRPCYNGRQFAACTNNLCMQGIGVAEVVHRAVEFVQGRLAAGAAQPV